MIDVEYFIEHGIHHFKNRVSSDSCRLLLDKVNETREFGSSLFVDEAEFLANPKFKGVNPEVGRNLAEKFKEEIQFIDTDEYVVEVLGKILGGGYKVKDKKFVCGVPSEWMPDWVEAYIADHGVKNLGPFIKPEYQDITYFSGIDFHQDIIDWPSMGPNFITMYVYLDDVGVHDAPLHLMPNSHLLGATTFPHKLEKQGGNLWCYTDDEGESIKIEHKLLTGVSGDISLWHPFILHGTQPDANSKPRLSLRYLIQVADAECEAACALQEVNKKIKGSMALGETRRDLDITGKIVMKGNYVNSIKNPS